MTTTTVAIIALTYIVAITLQIFWCDWIIQSIYNKDINNWLLLAILSVIALLTPRSLNGIICFSMMIATAYIWFIK